MRHRVRSALLFAALILALRTSSTTVSTQSSPQYGVNDLGTLGGPSAVAVAIDDNAFPAIGGTSTTASGATHAFYRDLVGTMHDMGTLGGPASESHGLGVGRAQLASGAWHAFSGGPSGPMIDLGTLGGSQSTANHLAQVNTGQ